MFGTLRLFQELLSCWPPGRFNVIYARHHPGLCEVPAEEVDGVGSPTPLPFPDPLDCEGGEVGAGLLAQPGEGGEDEELGLCSDPPTTH